MHGHQRHQLRRNATSDDGSCTYPPVDVPGCTDTNATNHNTNATTDDGSCTYPPADVPGCMDTNATNFDANATVDDASCAFSDPGATPDGNQTGGEDDITTTDPAEPTNGTVTPWQTCRPAGHRGRCLAARPGVDGAVLGHSAHGLMKGDGRPRPHGNG
ncbi:MAG: hypothetical protein CM15mP18_1620 [Methanobacteriota archaeon]|nr:MAG: hypothetical protein CM15mP18_1620 [Euryarchaeota archaeon]